MQHDEDVPPEEKEKWSLDRERDADALHDYRKVERVIDTREDDDGGTQYYIKCKFLLYLLTSLYLTACREEPLL